MERAPSGPYAFIKKGRKGKERKGEGAGGQEQAVTQTRRHGQSLCLLGLGQGLIQKYSTQEVCEHQSQAT